MFSFSSILLDVLFNKLSETKTKTNDRDSVHNLLVKLLFNHRVFSTIKRYCKTIANKAGGPKVLFNVKSVSGPFAFNKTLKYGSKILFAVGLLGGVGRRTFQ